LRGIILGVVAFIMPLMVHASPQEEAYFKIPVIPLHLKAGVTCLCAAEPPQPIIIHVKGPAAAIAKLPSLKLTYDLNLKGVDIGYHVIPVSKDCVKLPEGISIVAMDPPQIHIRLDEEIEKELPVKIVCKGNPAPGYTITGTVTTPDRILLKGPKQILKNIQYISTVPIDVTAVSASFKKEAPLAILENVNVVALSSPIIAQIDVEEQIITRTVKDIAVQGRDTSHDFKISPLHITIRLKGPANTLSKLSFKDDLNVYIDLAGLQPGVFVRRATIELPAEITLVDVAPKIFTVKIQ
jgi:YbbR domain-containing protein